MRKAALLVFIAAFAHKLRPPKGLASGRSVQSPMLIGNMALTTGWLVSPRSGDSGC
jgi:hypothetical protein